MPARRRIIFVHENQDPIQFYLHKSVEDDQRNELTELIQVVDPFLCAVYSNNFYTEIWWSST